MHDPNRSADEILGQMNWKLTLALGVVMILGGALALLNPFAATLTVVAIASATFLIAGIGQLWLAFRDEGGADSRLISGALGVLLVLFSLSLLFQPFAGMISLTLLAASFFLVTGAVRVWLAVRMRHRRRWAWLMASGLLSVLLGLLIFVALPGAALSILGIFLGVELLFSGAALVALALGERP